MFKELLKKIIPSLVEEGFQLLKEWRVNRRIKILHKQVDLQNSNVDKKN